MDDAIKGWAARNPGLSTYADTEVNEWFGEAFTMLTRPDYVPGTIDGDREVWAMLAEGRLWTPATRVAPPVTQAFPPFPDVPDLAPGGDLIEGWASGNEVFKGTTNGVVLTDPAGRRWFWKYSDPEEIAGADITRLYGLNAPPVKPMAYDGRWGVLWPAVDPAESYAQRHLVAGRPFSTLPPSEVHDITAHAWLDWIMGNIDGHPGNYLRDTAGRVWAIDKGRALGWEMGESLSLSDWYLVADHVESVTPGALWHSMLPTGRAPGSDPGLLLRSLDPDDVARMIDRFEAVPASSLAAILDVWRVAPAVRQEALDRAAAIRDNVSGFYADLLKMADPAQVPPVWRTWDGAFPRHRAAAPDDLDLPGIPPMADLVDPKTSGIFNAHRPGELVVALADATPAERAAVAAMYKATVTLWKMDPNVVPMDWYSWMLKDGTFDVPSPVKPGYTSTSKPYVPGQWGGSGKPWKPAPPPPPKEPTTPFGGQTYPVTALPENATITPIDVPGSDLQLDIDPVPWSGTIPFDDPPMPANAYIEADHKALRAAAQDAWYGWQDVQAGDVRYALVFGKADTDKARKAGLLVEKMPDERYYATTSQKRVKQLRRFIEQSGDTNTDQFWTEWLGYSQTRLDAIDAYEAAKGGGKSMRAGVLIREPDGRLWFVAPRNRYAGYENTWSKGGIEAGETIPEAAVREVREEMGISVELDEYLGDFLSTDGGTMNRYYIGHRTGGGPSFAKVKETYAIRLGTPEQIRPVLLRYGKQDVRDTAVLDTYLEQAGLPPIGPTAEEVVAKAPPGEVLGDALDDVHAPSTGEPVPVWWGYDPNDAQATATLFKGNLGVGGGYDQYVPGGVIHASLLGIPTGGQRTLTVHELPSVPDPQRRGYLAGLVIGAIDQTQPGEMLILKAGPAGMNLLAETIGVILWNVPMATAPVSITLNTSQMALVRRALLDPGAPPAGAPTVGFSTADANTLAGKLAPADPLAPGPAASAPAAVSFSTAHGYDKVVLDGIAASSIGAPAGAKYQKWAVVTPSGATLPFDGAETLLKTLRVNPIQNLALAAAPLQLPLALKAIDKAADSVVAKMYLPGGWMTVPNLPDILVAAGATAAPAGGYWLEPSALQKLRTAMTTDQPITQVGHIPTGALNPAAQAQVTNPALAHVPAAAATPPPPPAATAMPTSAPTSTFGQQHDWDIGAANDFVLADPAPMLDPGGPGYMVEWLLPSGEGATVLWDISPTGNLRLNSVIWIGLPQYEMQAALVAQIKAFARIDGHAHRRPHQAPRHPLRRRGPQRALAQLPQDARRRGAEGQRIWRLDPRAQGDQGSGGGPRQPPVHPAGLAVGARERGHRPGDRARGAVRPGHASGTGGRTLRWPQGGPRHRPDVGHGPEHRHPHQAHGHPRPVPDPLG